MKNSRELLENFATYDQGEMGEISTPHADNCGHCHHLRLFAVVAREMLAEERYEIDEWSRRVQEQWRASKYFQVYQAEGMEGLKRRGWEP